MPCGGAASLTGSTKNDTYLMTVDVKRVPARFYRTPHGNEPVREWLKGLEPDARRRIGF